MLANETRFNRFNWQRLAFLL